MIGRGLVLNPGLCSRKSTKEQFRTFHEKLLSGYLSRNLGDTNVLFKMKELWFYQIHLFADVKSYEERLSEYMKIVEALLGEREFCPPS